jgi:hypothetical protein
VEEASNKMNPFNNCSAKILAFLHTQFPKPSEIMMHEIIENFGDKNQCEAFIGTMDFLASEGYLTYQDSTFGRQRYSMVTLTEKGLSVFEKRGRFHGIR